MEAETFTVVGERFNLWTTLHAPLPAPALTIEALDTYLRDRFGVQLQSVSVGDALLYADFLPDADDSVGLTLPELARRADAATAAAAADGEDADGRDAASGGAGPSLAALFDASAAGAGAGVDLEVRPVGLPGNAPVPLCLLTSRHTNPSLWTCRWCVWTRKGKTCDCRRCGWRWPSRRAPRRNPTVMAVVAVVVGGGRRRERTRAARAKAGRAGVVALPG